MRKPIVFVRSGEKPSAEKEADATDSRGWCRDRGLDQGGGDLRPPGRGKVWALFAC